jgi:tagatose 1,6-diphosphate aldolase
MPVFAQGGGDALEEWLLDRGVKNIQALNVVVNQGAKPWYDRYGGLDNIEVVG